MSLLKNLKTDDTIGGETDSVGGGGKVFESGTYKFNVALAYLQKSKGGALGLFLHLKTEDGQELKQAMYLTGGDAKGNLNYYVDQKSKEKHYLPGFNMGNSLAMLTVGKEISDLDTETKVVNLYSYEAKTEVATKVEVVTDLMGQEIIAGVIKQTVDKNVKADDGSYVPTGETREENEIDKFFCAKDKYLNMTTAEIKAKAEAPAFFTTWSDKWNGKTKDKTSKDAGSAVKRPPVGGKAGAGAGKPSSGLFSDDE